MKKSVMKKVAFFFLLFFSQVLMYITVDNYSYGLVSTANYTAECLNAFFYNLFDMGDAMYAYDVSLGKMLFISYALMISMPIFIFGAKSFYKNRKDKKFPWPLFSSVVIMASVAMLSYASVIQLGIELVNDGFYDIQGYLEIFLLIPGYTGLVMILYVSLMKVFDPFEMEKTSEEALAETT